MATKGLAPTNTTINTVSDRHDIANPYVSATIRLNTSGGRGIY